MCYIWLLIKQQDDCTPCWLQNYIPRSRTSKKPSIRPATRPYSGSMIHWIMMNNHSLPSRSRGNILNHFEIIEWIFPCQLCTDVNVERGTIFKQHFLDSLPPVTCKHLSKNRKYRPAARAGQLLLSWTETTFTFHISIKKSLDNVKIEK